MQNRRIFFNTLWMLFDRVFILVLKLVVIVKIANYYGPQEYGMYQYAVSVVAIFEMCVTFVDGRVVKKKYENNAPENLVWNATLSRMLFSVLALLIGTIYLLLSGENAEYNLIFIILLLNSIIINVRFGMQNRYEYIYKAKKIVISSNIALTIGGFLQLVAVYFNFAISVIAIITAISSLICLVIIYKQYQKDFGSIFKGKFSRKIIQELVQESIPLAIAASCATIYSRCDSIMIGNMLSKAEVGIYAIAVNLIHVVEIALIPIRESVFPKMIQLYRTDLKQYERRYIQITAVMTWVYILGVSASFIILPILFEFMNAEYALAYPIYKIYVISAFFMYNAGLRAGHYAIINRGSILMYSQIISVIANVILNYLLIKTIGVYGAAIATVITECISLWISNIFFGRTGREVLIWQIMGLNPLHIFKQ